VSAPVAVLAELVRPAVAQSLAVAAVVPRALALQELAQVLLVQRRELEVPAAADKLSAAVRAPAILA
jgi:hypothetical protein